MPFGFFRSLVKGSDPKPFARIFTPAERLLKFYLKQARQTSPEYIEGSQNKSQGRAKSYEYIRNFNDQFCLFLGKFPLWLRP